MSGTRTILNSAPIELNHERPVLGAKFTADSTVLTWTANEVQLWNLNGGRPLVVPLPSAPEDLFHDVERQKLVALLSDGSVILWDLSKAQAIGQYRYGAGD